MYEYEMNPTRTVGATERTRDAGRTDRWTDGRTNGVKPIYSPTTSLCGGITNSPFAIELGRHDACVTSDFPCDVYVYMIYMRRKSEKHSQANMRHLGKNHVVTTALADGLVSVATTSAG